MTKHPITPPPELVKKLWREASSGRNDAPIGEIFNHGVHLAFAAGADQELEACIAWLKWQKLASHENLTAYLRAMRRPKPPSLKEQALEAQMRMWSGTSNHDDWDLVRSALEQLPDAL